MVFLGGVLASTNPPAKPPTPDFCPKIGKYTHFQKEELIKELPRGGGTVEGEKQKS
jgi:hypothetical protein